MDDLVIQVDGYSLLRKYRNVEGSGVALYVRNTFKAKFLRKSNRSLKLIKGALNADLLSTKGIRSSFDI